jgi:hypothetical protein
MSLCECNVYYASDQFCGLCSSCFNKKSNPDAFPDYSNPSLLVDEFKRYARNNNYLITLREKKSEQDLICNLCKDSSPGEIMKLLCGGSELETSALLASTGDRILDQVYTHGNSLYIHSICPWIIDPWNLVSNNNTVVCYYKEFGEMKVPLTKAELHKIWSTKFVLNRDLSWKFPDTCIWECCICMDKITNAGINNKGVVKCVKCREKFHRTCMEKAIVAAGMTLACPKCRSTEPMTYCRLNSWI